MKIALFIPDTGKALVRLLTRLGHEMDFPAGQTCCGQMHLPLTFVSGPSATSDIELSRVEGVHGPRTLEVFLTP